MGGTAPMYLSEPHLGRCEGAECGPAPLPAQIAVDFGGATVVGPVDPASHCLFVRSSWLRPGPLEFRSDGPTPRQQGGGMAGGVRSPAVRGRSRPLGRTPGMDLRPPGRTAARNCGGWIDFTSVRCTAGLENGDQGSESFVSQ